MNKTDLVEALAPRLGGRARAQTAVEAMVDVILREVAAGGSVGVTGFGVFESVERAPRTGRNPRTGQAVPIEGTRTARFRPAAYFREVVGDPSLLPSEGLAGVRTGSQQDVERAGAPASVRRTRPPETHEERSPMTREDEFMETQEPPAEPHPPRSPSTGAPETVRRIRPQPVSEEPVGADADPTHPAGSVVIAGEDITQSMLASRKQRLARMHEDVAAGGRSKGRKGGTGKAGKAGKTGKKAGKKSGKKKSKGKGDEQPG